MVIILCIYTLWVIQQTAEYSCAQIICYVLKEKQIMPAPDSIAATPSDSNCHIKFQAVSRVIALQHNLQIVYT